MLPAVPWLCSPLQDCEGHRGCEMVIVSPSQEIVVLTEGTVCWEWTERAL